MPNDQNNLGDEVGKAKPIWTKPVGDLIFTRVHKPQKNYDLLWKNIDTIMYTDILIMQFKLVKCDI